MELSQIKDGDKVRCKRDLSDDIEFIAGRTYTVAEVDDFDGCYPFLLQDTDDDSENAWLTKGQMSGYFECLDEPAVAPRRFKYTVYKHADADVQIWEQNGVIQVKRSGRNVKGKKFTVTQNVDKWVEAFFDGYLTAQ